MAKMSQEEQTLPKVTMAKLFKLESHEDFSFPNHFLDALKPKNGQYAIMILTPNTKIVRIIPTDSQKVFKIAIDINQLSPDFLKNIGNLFLELSLETLYSTGLCFIEERCIFDAYIDSKEFEKIDTEEVRQRILKFKGISAVDINVLEIQ
jgi:hypothetical protein